MVGGARSVKPNNKQVSQKEREKSVMSTNETNTQLAGASEESSFPFRVAFDKTATERAAIDPSDFASLRVDLSLAINTVMVAHPKIENLRKEIAGLPVNQQAIDSLYTFAQAAAHAVALYRVATMPPEELDALYQEGLQRRNALKSDATNLVVYGLVSRDAVAALTGETGFRNVGYDLMSLVGLFRAARDRIAGRTAAQAADIDRAEVIGNQLLMMFAARESRKALTGDLAEARLRAFTLMQNAYEEARRAVEFLRWYQGDAHEIAPSFYGTKGSRRKDDEPAEPVVVNVPVGDGTVANPQVNAQSPAGNPTVNPAVPGARGGSPFV